MRTRSCEVCGVDFPYGGRHTQRKYCSNKCRRRRDNAKEWGREPNLPTTEPRICECFTEFIPRRATQKFCSSACRNRIYARRRQSGYDVFYLYRRDRGVCVVCSLPVDPMLRWPEAGTPTVEHLLPLSRGGTNDHGNLALAHWECNRQKGTRTLAEMR